MTRNEHIGFFVSVVYMHGIFHYVCIRMFTQQSGQDFQSVGSQIVVRIYECDVFPSGQSDAYITGFAQTAILGAVHDSYASVPRSPFVTQPAAPVGTGIIHQDDFHIGGLLLRTNAFQTKIQIFFYVVYRNDDGQQRLFGNRFHFI